jgi:uncharacterized protein (TIGR02145 family)
MKNLLFGLVLLLIVSCSKEEVSEPIKVTDINGTTYTTAVIGNQTWSKENLQVSKYSDGTIIPEVNDPEAWSALTTGAWCYYATNNDSGVAFGKLYNWYAIVGIHDATSLNDATTRKKIVPNGFHVPTDAEWTILSNYLGANAGGKMKEIGIVNWIETNPETTNSSFFTGLPGGIRLNDGTFYFIGDYGYWWSSTSIDSNVAWNRSLGYNSNFVCRSYDDKNYGFSVRFIKD